MKKRGILSIAMAGCLAAVALGGATLAYFTSNTEDVVNTFTVGDVQIDLTEPDWKPEDAKGLQPGAAVDKNPLITNTGAGEGYVLMQVSGVDDMKAAGFKAGMKDAAGNVTDKVNEGWVLVDEKGNVVANWDGSLVDGYYVYTANDGVLESGKTTAPLFEAVALSEDAQENASTTYKVMGNFQDEKGLFTYKDAAGQVIEANVGRQPSVMNADGTPKVIYTINGVDGKTFETAAAAQEYVVENLKETASSVFNLTVKGYAIQTTNIDFAPYTNWVPELTGAGK